MIFITRNDVLGYGLPIYHVNRKIEEVNESFHDESHIIYVNSKIQDDTKLGRLMHDLHCQNAEDMYSEVLANRVRELKETEEGVEVMCKEMEQIYSEGREVGELSSLISLVIKKVQKGLEVEQIAEILEKTPETIEKICNVAESFAPDYDIEAICQKLLEEQ